MSSPVTRSFSPFGESDESGSDYKRGSFSFFSADHKGLSWSDLLRKRLVIIVGEAGIGKTFEFKNEAETLASEGQAAFLLPLNLLDTPEGFDQALINQRERYDRWVESNDTGYFFLDAVGVENLEVAQLAEIFSRTSAESKFGSGPMAMALKNHLLPSLSFPATLKLLSGLLAALPAGGVREFARRSEGGQRREAWILRILPHVLLYILRLSNSLEMDDLRVITNASFVIEKLKYTTFAREEDFRQLRMEIEKHPQIRQHLARGIALSVASSRSASYLTRGAGLVHLSVQDLDWVVQEAMREDLSQPSRQVWYEVAVEIAFTNLDGAGRTRILSDLTGGVDAELRSSGWFQVLKRSIELTIHLDPLPLLSLSPRRLHRRTARRFH